MSKIILGATADGHNVSIDLELLLSTRALLTADSGGGKTFALKRIVEKAFGKIQIIIIDPEGEFSPLREKLDFVLVGKGGETPADVRSAALVAQTILKLRASAIVDLYENKPSERHAYVKAFLDALIEAPKEMRHPCLVIVDEAHIFCPEHGKGESVASESMIGLCTRGRKRLLCPLFATQRLATLSKDASSMLLNRMIGPTFEDINRKRAADVLGIAKDGQKEFYRQIQTLEPGNFFCLGRAISKEMVLVHVGPIETPHGQDALKYEMTPPPPPEAIKALLPKLADLPKAAEDKARTDAEFKREIRELHMKLKVAERAAQNAAVHVAHTLQPTDPKAIERAVAAAVKPYREQLHAIKQHVARASRSLPIVRSSLEDLEKALEMPVTIVTDVTKQAAAPTAPKVHTRVLIAPARPPREPRAIVEGNGDLSGPEQNILNQLAELEALGITQPEKSQLALMAGYTNSRSGGFSEPLAGLLNRGYLSYPRSGVTELTEEGRVHARPVDRPLSVSELHERLCQKLGGPEAKLLRELISIYPSSISKEELGARLGYTNVRSGGFSEPVGRLRALGIAEYPQKNEVKAADWLFLEAA